MNVEKITFVSWRNIPLSEVKFERGINVLWGMNAQGKSNVLEGIYYFARGRSFRGAKDKELIEFGHPYASALLEFRRDGYEKSTTLEAVIPQSGKKKIRKNSADLTAAAEMIGVFRATLFCPKDLATVTGGPLERRTFLDVAISQLSEEYLFYLRRYTKALTERNALLKRAAAERVTKEEWEVYAEVMAESAAVVASYRAEYTELLSEEVKKYFRGMTRGVEEPSLRYTSHAMAPSMPSPLKGAFSMPERVLYDKLLSNIEREVAAGSTLWGIHKDEVALEINGREAKLYASQGQQRSIALAAKIAEAEISSRLSGEYPVILLDDVFSELDENRRRFILDSLDVSSSPQKQIIITSCEPDIIPKEDFSAVSFRHVEDGGIVG